MIRTHRILSVESRPHTRNLGTCAADVRLTLDSDVAAERSYGEEPLKGVYRREGESVVTVTLPDDALPGEGDLLTLRPALD